MTTQPSARTNWLLFGSVALLTLLADQASKWWARASLPVDDYGNGLSVSVIANLWDWRLAYNKGSAFSMLGDVSSGRIILTVIGFARLSILLYTIAGSPTKQGLHDRYARTIVVKSGRRAT